MHMRLECNGLVIRDFEKKDIPALREIVREREIARFMRDWSENSAVPGRLEGYVEWLQTQRDSTDVYENKRYAVVLQVTGALVGMVGMGQEEMTREVELAYFICPSCRGKGYAPSAAQALADWCFSVSDLPYLILTVDCANTASCRVAEKSGFVLFEKRTPIGHTQPNMVSDSYYYYRKYRP